MLRKQRKKRYCPRIPGDGAIFFILSFFVPIFYSISSSLIAFGVDGWRAEERDLFSPHTYTTHWLTHPFVCMCVRMSICRIMKGMTALKKSEARRIFLPRSLARMVLKLARTRMMTTLLICFCLCLVDSIVVVARIVLMGSVAAVRCKRERKKCRRCSCACPHRYTYMHAHVFLCYQHRHFIHMLQRKKRRREKGKEREKRERI